MDRRWRVGILGAVVLVGCSRGPAPEASRAPATTSPATAPIATGPPATGPPPTGPCPPATTTVTTADQLQDALASATAGAVIVLEPGTYEGRFEAKAVATEDQPIHLCGPRDAILDGGATRTGVTLHLDGAVAWRVSGFTVRHGQKGIVTDRTQHSVLEDLQVEDVGDEAIHLRTHSSDNTVRGTIVRGTGSFEVKYGEGIYIGSAQSNWCTYTDCQPDRSDRNVIEGNDIAGTSTESIDLKEGTTGGVVRNNVYDGSAMTAEDSWLDVKGNDWVIEGNRGEHAPVDGYQVHRILDGWGTGNVFRGNVSHVDAPGYGFNLHHVAGNQVACDNIVTGAAMGVADVACSG